MAPSAQKNQSRTYNGQPSRRTRNKLPRTHENRTSLQIRPPVNTSATGLQSASERHALSDSSIVQELVTPQVPLRCRISKLCVLELVYTSKLDREADFVPCIMCCIPVDRLSAVSSRRDTSVGEGMPVSFSSISMGAKGRPVAWDDCLHINRPLSMLPGDGFEEQVVHSPCLSTCINTRALHSPSLITSSEPPTHTSPMPTMLPMQTAQHTTMSTHTPLP